MRALFVFMAYLIVSVMLLSIGYVIGQSDMRTDMYSAGIEDAKLEFSACLQGTRIFWFGKARVMPDGKGLAFVQVIEGGDVKASTAPAPSRKRSM